MPPPIAEILATARHYHRAGALARAEELYRQAVAADASNDEAWMLLAQACQGQNRPADAAEHYRQALRVRPDLAAAHSGLGIALVRLGDRTGAEASFRRAIELRPAYTQALNNLGNVLKEMGRTAEAESCYERAVRAGPDFVPALANLGWLLLDLGRPAEAEPRFREALRLDPESATAHLGLGAALTRRRQWDEAIASCREAVRLQPNVADGHAALAAALAEAGKLDEALAHWSEAARLAPTLAAARTGIGLALLARGDLEEAAAHCREAVRLQPASADAHVGLGAVQAERARPDEALACYARALELAPDHPEAHRNRSLLWLLQGDFARGWPEYEWRWRCKELPPRPFPQPRWEGGPLGGKTILLHAEQGLGDTLQFVRYAPLIKARGGTVVVACQRPLLPLLRGCPGVDRLAAQGDQLPPFDVHAPLMSLPLLFGTDLRSIPANVPYLRSDPALVCHWRAWLDALPGFKVGIAWQGSDRHKRDRQRSVPLSAFEPLARAGGVRLVSLQKGAGSEQAAALGGRFGVAEPPGLDESAGPLMDTAAVLSSLDLVVCCDSAVGHLAGALGVPCWLALAAVPDWRWMLGRQDSPWYPRHHLFRQDTPGDWQGVFRRIAEALRERVGRQASAPSVTVEVSPGELLDKITILEIKSQRISDSAKLRNVAIELKALEAARRSLPDAPELAALTAELRAVNEALWQIEDDIRRCEREGDFGARFVELARSVYRTNDRRAALKRRVNELLGARIVEVKSYADYGP